MALDEELENLKQDIEKIKDRILNINKNLNMELENYARNRMEGLKKIMGYSCYADSEIGRKITEFSASRQKNFPPFTFAETPSLIEAEDSAEEQKLDDLAEDKHKLGDGDNFEAIE